MRKRKTNTKLFFAATQSEVTLQLTFSVVILLVAFAGFEDAKFTAEAELVSAVTSSMVAPF